MAGRRHLRGTQGRNGAFVKPDDSGVVIAELQISVEHHGTELHVMLEGVAQNDLAIRLRQQYQRRAIREGENETH